MASGFFLGGAADGAMAAQQQALKEQTQAQDVGLRTRGLDLQERQLGHTMSQDVAKQADAQIAQTMEIVSQTIKEGLAGGAPPDKIRAAVTPLVQSAQSIAQRVGRDPAALAATLDAQISNPGPVATAAVGGRAEGVKTVEKERAIQQQPAETRIEINPYKTEEERVKLENSLRDDFVKGSKEFTTVRDFYDRMKIASATGAGDLSTVFSFMKMLDPPSTVREGEQASAANAAGVPEAIRGLYNKVAGGGTLSEEARKQIKDEGAKIWGTALSRHSQHVTQYTNIAKRQKLNHQNVIVDLTSGSEGPSAPAAPVSGTTATGIQWNWPGTGP